EETARDRAEAARALEQAGRERRRLVELRRRLRRRWKRHWGGQEQDLRRREEEVARQAERLRAERGVLTRARLRFHGDAELGRRQIEDGWGELDKGQRQWQAERERQEAELARKERELHEGRMALAAAQRDHAAREARARAARAALEREAEGLENRVRNLHR